MDLMRFAGSWIFFSITTTISLLALFRTSGAIGVGEWLAIVLKQYEDFAVLAFSWLQGLRLPFNLELDFSLHERVSASAFAIILAPFIIKMSELKFPALATAPVLLYLATVLYFGIFDTLPPEHDILVTIGFCMFWTSIFINKLALRRLTPRVTLSTFRSGQSIDRGEISSAASAHAFDFVNQFVGALIIIFALMVSGVVIVLV